MLGSSRVDRQGKGLNRCKHWTWIVDILKLYRLYQLVDIVLWREIGDITIAQDRWSWIGGDLVAERNAR